MANEYRDALDRLLHQRIQAVFSESDYLVVDLHGNIDPGPIVNFHLERDTKGSLYSVQLSVVNMGLVFARGNCGPTEYLRPGSWVRVFEKITRDTFTRHNTSQLLEALDKVLERSRRFSPIDDGQYLLQPTEIG